MACESEVTEREKTQRVRIGKPWKNGNNRDICLRIHSVYDGRLCKLCEESRIRRKI